ncbi:MAG TPA: hypothetical protein VKR32_04730 [Puia sp.]|nr:hypothetical protein [Puia sp.]
MKINQLLKAFWQKFGSGLISAFLVCIGFMFAFNLLEKLGAVAVAHKHREHKDTVYVSLLNGVPAYQPGSETIQPNSQSSSREKHDTTQPATSAPTNLQASQVYQPAVPITDSERRAAMTTATGKASNIPSIFQLFLFLLILGILGSSYVGYFGLPERSEEMNRDIDPPELTSLFNGYSTQIEALGNPRKIKRLSNKIRFQFNYLVIKGLANENNLDYMARILILFEQQSILAPLEPAKARLLTSNIDSFKAFVREKGISVSDDKFLRLMFALNRDSFY